MKTPKAQRDFINHFIEQDFRNATGAYQRAFPKASYDTAKVEASRLLTKPYIQGYMAETLAEIIRRDKIPLEKRIFDYWVKRAFYDITEIIGIDGEMKLTDEKLREKGLEVCIDSINKKTDAQGREIITYKFADKDKAAEMLEKYIQMIKPQAQDLNITGGISSLTPEERDKEIADMLAEAMKAVKK
jgi:phage terminase small subunit